MKRQFTIGIVDDVTDLSLPEDKNCPNTAAEGTIECKFWGLGGDGTVGANKNSIKIIGDHTDKYVQAYFQYDSKKTGGVTISHLRFGDKPIKSPVLHQQGRLRRLPQPQSYIIKGFKMVDDVKPGGVFMINCQWDFDELDHHLQRRRQALHRQEQHPALHHQRHRPGHRDRHGQAHQHHPSVRVLLPGQGHARGGGHPVHEGRRRRTPT